MIRHACSKGNGIIFFSNKFPRAATIIYYDENENMQIWIGFVKYSESPHNMKHKKKYKQFFENNFPIIILILTVLLFSFLLFKFSQNFCFIVAGILFWCPSVYSFWKLKIFDIFKKSPNGFLQLNFMVLNIWRFKRMIH